MASCSAPDCPRPSSARGLCGACYSKARRAGQFALRPHRRLKASDIPKIRAMRTAGLSYSTIAAGFGVTASTIGHATAGRTWKPLWVAMSNGAPAGIAELEAVLAARPLTPEVVMLPRDWTAELLRYVRTLERRGAQG